MPMTTHRIRVGIDVGGTFTDAVAVDATTLELLGQVKVPTSHHHEDGVAHGIVEALDRLLKQTGHAPQDVAFLAHGTTQATNALLEGDVATVGLIGIGAGPGAGVHPPARRSCESSNSPRASGFRSPTRMSPTRRTRAAVDRAVDEVDRRRGAKSRRHPAVQRGPPRRARRRYARPPGPADCR